MGGINSIYYLCFNAWDLKFVIEWYAIWNFNGIKNFQTLQNCLKCTNSMLLLVLTRSAYLEFDFLRLFKNIGNILHI